MIAGNNIYLLLIYSLSFFIVGIISYLFPPKKINGLYGYRTKKSMLNQENWTIAQKYSTNLILKNSIILIFISIILMIVKINLLIQIILEIFLMIVSLIFLFYKVEKKLKTK